MLALARIPIRAGGARGIRSRLYTRRFTVPDETRSAISHHIAAMGVFDVAGADSLPRVYLSPEEREAGRKLLEREAGEPGAGGPVVAIHPGGTWQAKRWPASSFAALSLLIRERFGGRAVVVTGPGEEEIAESVQAAARGAARSLSHRPLREIASILASCDAVVANDGGLMHLAVALGRPTIGVFGPTEPDIWFPYEGRGPFALASRRMGCAPCHRHECADPECLEGIEPANVLGLLEKVIGRKREAPRTNL
jgi:ADP-heptose:LPS heptosyltransferase